MGWAPPTPARILHSRGTQDPRSAAQCLRPRRREPGRPRSNLCCLYAPAFCLLPARAKRITFQRQPPGSLITHRYLKGKKKSPHNIYRKTLLEKKKKKSLLEWGGGKIKKYIYFSRPKETLFSESKFTGGGQVHWPEVEVGDGRQGGSHSHVTSGSPIGQSPLLRQRRSGKQRGSRSDPHQCLPAASVCLGVPYGRHVT